MGLLLAAATALSIGLSEVFGSRAAKRARPIEVTALYFFVGTVLFLLLVPLVTEQFDGRMLTYGFLAGLVNAVALVMLHYAYKHSGVGVALPIVAVVSLGVPVAVDALVHGHRPSAIAALGIALGVFAVALTSFQGDRSGWLSKGALLALASGAIFGFVYPLIAEIDPEQGMLPLAVQRGSGFVLVASVALASGPQLFPQRNTRLLPGASALFSAVAVISFALAAQRTSLTEASVVANQFPAIAVLGAWLVNGESVRWWQWIGLAGACGAVALIAIG